MKIMPQLPILAIVLLLVMLSVAIVLIQGNVLHVAEMVEGLIIYLVQEKVLLRIVGFVVVVVGVHIVSDNVTFPMWGLSFPACCPPIVNHPKPKLATSVSFNNKIFGQMQKVALDRMFVCV